MPNPGRLSELLHTGVKLVLREVDGVDKRKTVYDIVGVYHVDKLVSIDSHVPNRLVFEALKNGDLPEFLGYSKIKKEYSYEHVKFDFFLSNGLKPCLLEVKSCILIRKGKAMFPDAPTRRGARHVLKLAKALNEGYRGAILFVIQGGEAYVFKPNYETDPVFGNALQEAAFHGLEVYAYSAIFVKNKIMLNGKVNVQLQPC